MILSSPSFLLVGLLGLLVWVGPFRGRDAVQNILRSVLLLILAVALAEPHVVSTGAPPERIVVIDESASIAAGQSENALQRAMQAAQTSHEKTHLVRISDAAEPPRVPTRLFASVTTLLPSGSEGGSPLSAAMSRAASLVPLAGSARVVVATDGLATRPDDAGAVQTLRSQGVVVDVVPLESAPLPAVPAGLTWSEPLRVGSTARLQARVIARGSADPGKVLLRAGNDRLAEADYSGGEQETLELQFEPRQAGFVEAELVVYPGSEREAALPVVLAVREPRRLLYLGDVQQNGAVRLNELIGPGFATAPLNTSDAAAIGRQLASADLVVLDDRPADTVAREVENQIVKAVTDEGLGLVMSGGRGSFGSGGWHDRPVETVLPTELVQKEEKRDPSTSLVIVIDTSGSMTGVRVQLAKEVARLAMRRLLPHDKVGIVEFFGSKRWAAPLQPASNAIELQRALNRMDAGGGTVILPALEEAFYGLQNIDTRYKHVLVLTDGGVEAGDFESLMRRMSAEGINVSTVLCGGGYHSEFLVNIANWGKGRFYNVPNRFNLPEILLKQPSTAKLPSYRPGSHPVRARGGSGWWGDVQTSAIPELAGYVETKARVGSEVLLETVEGNHPVLTTWRYGLGRVTTFATEPVGEGTRPWQDWADYGKALGRILERSSADTRDAFRFETEYDGGDVVLHAIRQRPRSGSSVDALPVATWTDFNGDSHDVPFIARSPNRFLARLPIPPSGDFLRVLAGSTTTPDRLEPIAVASPIVPEDRVDPAHAVDLPGLAAVTGGQIESLDSDWFAQTIEPGGHRLLPLMPWLFGLALVLFLLELIWRRRPSRRGVVA